MHSEIREAHLKLVKATDCGTFKNTSNTRIQLINMLKKEQIKSSVINITTSELNSRKTYKFIFYGCSLIWLSFPKLNNRRVEK